MICVVLLLCSRFVWCLTHGTTIQGSQDGQPGGCQELRPGVAGDQRLGSQWSLVGTGLKYAHMCAAAWRIALRLSWSARQSQGEQQGSKGAQWPGSVAVADLCSLNSLSDYEAGHRIDEAAPSGPP